MTDYEKEETSNLVRICV